MFCCGADGQQGAEEVYAEQAPTAPETEPKKEEETKKAEPPLPAPVELAGPHTFEISLVKDGPLGIMLDTKSSGLSVMKIGRGCFEAHNAKAAPNNRLEKHDFIVSINGKTSQDSMLAEVKECKGTVTMKISRPMPWVVKMPKSGKPFGAGFGFQKDSCSMDIKDIVDGALKDHNARAAPGLQVQVCDIILKVNALETPQQMIEALKKTLTEFELTFARPPKA